MSKIDRHIPGTPSWGDLMTPDPEGARKFYGGLFGWTFAGGDDASMGFYAQCQIDGRNVAGMGKMPEGSPMPSAWSVYFDGVDADALAARIGENGGQVMMGPMDVMDFGRMLVAADPTGAVFGVWQGKSHTGAQLVDEPGSMCWHEVNTRDAVKAKDFYGKVFGLETRKLEAPGVEYYTLHQGEKTAGGVLQMDAHWPAELPPHWMVYFAVADVEASAARIEALGGKVGVKPFDTPYGRMAVATDPWGAHFTIMVPSSAAKAMG